MVAMSRVALITGASSGLGEAAAHRLEALAAAVAAPATVLALDLLAADAPERALAHVEEQREELVAGHTPKRV